MRRSVWVLLAGIPFCAFGQGYTVRAFAGGGIPSNTPGPAANLQSPTSVASDNAGNLYFTDTRNVVLRLDASTGTVGVVAGNGWAGFSGDGGPALSAQLNQPTGVAVDSAGALYIADTGNNVIRKVVNGVITTVAGKYAASVGHDAGDNGPATSALLSKPLGIALDSAGSLYIAETNGMAIRKVSNGVITTVAGGGPALYRGQTGPATNFQLSSPGGVAIDAAGNLFIADTDDFFVCEVSNGIISAVGAPAPPVITATTVRQPASY